MNQTSHKFLTKVLIPLLHGCKPFVPFPLVSLRIPAPLLAQSLTSQQAYPADNLAKTWLSWYKAPVLL